MTTKKFAGLIYGVKVCMCALKQHNASFSCRLTRNIRKQQVVVFACNKRWKFTISNVARKVSISRYKL